MNAKLSLFACAVLSLSVLGTSAQGTALIPGDTVVPGIVSDSPILLASLVEPVTTSTYTGTLTSAVFRDAGGTLEFDYQFANDRTSTDDVARMTMNPFKGFITDADFRIAAIGPFTTAGTVAPVTADRNGAADTVGFSFQPPDSAKIQPGETSNIVVIRTNATNFLQGTVSLIDGSTETLASFEPTSLPAPVSACAGLVLLGGFGALKCVRRQRTTGQP